MTAPAPASPAVSVVAPSPSQSRTSAPSLTHSLSPSTAPAPTFAVVVTENPERDGWEVAADVATVLGAAFALAALIAAGIIGWRQIKAMRDQIESAETTSATALAEAKTAREIAALEAERAEVRAERDKLNAFEVGTLLRLLDTVPDVHQPQPPFPTNEQFDLVARVSGDALPFWRDWLLYSGPRGADGIGWNVSDSTMRAMLTRHGVPEGWPFPYARLFWALRRLCWPFNTTP